VSLVLSDTMRPVRNGCGRPKAAAVPTDSSASDGDDDESRAERKTHKTAGDCYLNKYGGTLQRRRRVGRIYIRTRLFCKGGEKVVVCITCKGARGVEVNYLSAYIYTPRAASSARSSVRQTEFETSLPPPLYIYILYMRAHTHTHTHIYIHVVVLYPAVYTYALFFFLAAAAAVIVVSLSPRCKLPLPIRQPSSRPDSIVNSTHFPFFSPPGPPLSNYRRMCARARVRACVCLSLQKPKTLVSRVHIIVRVRVRI
jgi:hypothetical protein